jgi:hypothetical protein
MMKQRESERRSAEEVAREMVPEPLEQSGSWFVVVRDGEREITLAAWRTRAEVEEDRDDARAILASVITRAREEGAAAERERKVVIVESDALEHYREGLHRIWQGEANPRSIAADYLGEDPIEEQPCDLAGRIRVLMMQKASEYAAADKEDHSDALLEAIEDLWWVAHCVRKNRSTVNWVKSMRSRDRSDEHLAVLRQTADELEAIVRECAQETKR